MWWEALGNVGKLIGGIGGAYGAIKESQMAKKMYNLQKDMMNRNIRKESLAQRNLDSAINSVYGDEEEKKKKQNSNMPYFNLGA